MIYLQNNEGTIIYSPSFSFIQGNTQAKLFAKTTPLGNSDNLRKSYDIQFQDVTLTLVVSATFQPIDEATQVLVRFIPYISIIVIVIGVGSAYLYSRFITKPLIYINEGAQKMANLIFPKN